MDESLGRRSKSRRTSVDQERGGRNGGGGLEMVGGRHRRERGGKPLLGGRRRARRGGAVNLRWRCTPPGPR